MSFRSQYVWQYSMPTAPRALVNSADPHWTDWIPVAQFAWFLGPRHFYTPDEVDRAIKRPVVQSLFELIRFRNQHPAFSGSFSMPETSDTKIALRWDNGGDWAILEVNFAAGSSSISNSL